MKKTRRDFIKRAALGTAAAYPTGYRAVVAAHMANLSHRHKRRLTPEGAKATQPEF